MMWLTAFGAFLGGVARGLFGEPKPLQELAPKDKEKERNEKAREEILSAES